MWWKWVLMLYVGIVFVKFVVRKIRDPLNACGEFKTWGGRSEHFFRTTLAPDRPL